MLEYHRRSIRLRAYDYAQAGAYDITMCVQHRACLFGEVHDEVMRVNAAGQVIQARWDDIPFRFETVQLDEMIVMPNHVHAILLLGAEPSSAVADRLPVSLGQVVQWFKTMTTNDYIHGVKTHGWQPFHGRLWQRNYYEHIIRNGRDLERIRSYIEANPSRWTDDTENPDRPINESNTNNS